MSGPTQTTPSQPTDPRLLRALELAENSQEREKKTQQTAKNALANLKASQQEVADLQGKLSAQTSSYSGTVLKIVTVALFIFSVVLIADSAVRGKNINDWQQQFGADLGFNSTQ